MNFMKQPTPMTTSTGLSYVEERSNKIYPHLAPFSSVKMVPHVKLAINLSEYF